MFNRQQKPIRSFLSAAAIFASCGFAIGVAHATTSDVLTASIAATSTTDGMIEHASTLASQNKVWQARSVLVKVLNGAASLSDEQSTKVHTLLTSVNEKVRSLDSATLSVQKADVALDNGDLVTATNLCETVILNDNKSPQAEIARRMLTEASVMRDEFAAHSAETLERSTALFDAGKYAEAKLLLGSLKRSGIALPADQAQLLESYQTRLIALETTRGSLINTAEVAAAMFDDPGVIKRRTPPQPDQYYPAKEEKSQPAPAPAPAPATAPAKETKPAPAKTTDEKFAPPTKADPAPAKTVEGTPIPEIKDQPKAQDQPAQPSKPAEPVAPAKPVETPKPAQPVAPAPAPAPAAAPAAAPVTAAQPASDDLNALARKMRASELKTEADQNFASGRYGKAIEGYRTLRDVFASYLTAADLSDVNRRIAESETLLRGNTGENSLLTQELDRTKLNRDATYASFQNLMEQAEKSAATGDLGNARDRATQAKVTLQTNRSFFSESEFQALEKQAADKIAAFTKRGEDVAIKERNELEISQQKKAEQASYAAAQKKEKQVIESLQRVRALQIELKYEEALQVLDQILFIDPNNPAAEILKEVIQNSLIYRMHFNVQDRKARGSANLRLENNEASRIPIGLIEYPTDWPQITYRRGEAIQFQDTPENRRTLGMMKERRIPADFKEIPLENALAYIQKTTGVNMDINWAALEKVGIEKETAISMNIPDATAETIMERMIEKISPDKSTAAAWAVDNGILTVSSEQQINSRTVTEIYDVRDLLVEIPNFTNAPDFDLASVLKSDAASSGSAPFVASDKSSGLEHRTTPEQRTKEVIDIITNTVAHDTWQENGGEVGFVQQFQGALVVTTTPRVHKSIDGLLGKLRQQRAMQINVETRFLLVANDFFEQIGFDLDIYLNGTNNQVRAAQAANPAVVPSDFFPNGVYNRNLSIPQVGPLTGTTLQNTNQNLPGPQNGFSPISGGQNSLGLAEILMPQSGIYSDIAGKGPALGIAGQFLDDIQVDFLVKATQADRRNVQLTAPRLTFANGQIANIVVATQVAFVSDLTPVVSQSSAAFDPQLDVVSEGVRLLVEGYVSADRRYVTMNVSTSTSKIDGFTNAPITAIAGGTAVNSAALQSFIQRPTVTVTQVNTSVTIPDQGTCLLGGQRIANENEVETGVPILSKIPILGRLFDNRITNKTEQTLLILMKPTVLIQNEEEERQFPGLVGNSGL